jgi:hypothetical protein
MPVRFAVRLVAAMIGASVAINVPAFAHHSFAMFDDQRQVTLDGVVKEFQWTNPHMWIQIAVMENGQLVEYSIEGGPPLVMARKGWNRFSMKPGEKLKITINPTKDSTVKGGSFVGAVLEDGQTLSGRY